MHCNPPVAALLPRGPSLGWHQTKPSQADISTPPAPLLLLSRGQHTLHRGPPVAALLSAGAQPRVAADEGQPVQAALPTPAAPRLLRSRRCHSSWLCLRPICAPRCSSRRRLWFTPGLAHSSRILPQNEQGPTSIAQRGLVASCAKGCYDMICCICRQDLNDALESVQMGRAR